MGICSVAAVKSCGSSLCSGGDSMFCFDQNITEEHRLHQPPLPPTFYFQCFSFALTSQVTVNIVFLVTNTN